MLFHFDLFSFASLGFFLFCFLVSRLLQWRAYRRISKANAKELSLEYARYTRLLALLFFIVAAALIYVTLYADGGLLLVVRTGVTGLSMVLVASQTISQIVIARSSLPVEQKRPFVAVNALALLAFAALAVFVVNLWRI